jgi:hypothetical protein
MRSGRRRGVPTAGSWSPPRPPRRKGGSCNPLAFIGAWRTLIRTNPPKPAPPIQPQPQPAPCPLGRPHPLVRLCARLLRQPRLKQLTVVKPEVAHGLQEGAWGGGGTRQGERGRPGARARPRLLIGSFRLRRGRAQARMRSAGAERATAARGHSCCRQRPQLPPRPPPPTVKWWAGKRTKPRCASQARCMLALILGRPGQGAGEEGVGGCGVRGEGACAGRCPKTG